MIKPIKIISVKPYIIVCEFNNGVIKKINMEAILNKKYESIDYKKILNPHFFTTVTLGEFGQLFWSNAALMKDENGNSFTCEYDVSPEFVYNNSVKV